MNSMIFLTNYCSNTLCFFSLCNFISLVSLLNNIKKKKTSLGWVAQLVGVSSGIPKGFGFNPQSGHMF